MNTSCQPLHVFSLQTVDMGRLMPNPLQPITRLTPGATSRLRETIKATRSITPLIVARTNRNKLVIVDGHRRFLIAKELGYMKIQCLINGSDPTQAFVWANKAQLAFNGKTWLTIWALASPSSRPLVLGQMTRRTQECISVFSDMLGEAKAEEIGMRGKVAPSIVKTVGQVQDLFQRKQMTRFSDGKVLLWMIQYRAWRAAMVTVTAQEPLRNTLTKQMHFAIANSRPFSSRHKAVA